MRGESQPEAERRGSNHPDPRFERDHQRAEELHNFSTVGEVIEAFAKTHERMIATVKGGDKVAARDVAHGEDRSASESERSALEADAWIRIQEQALTTLRTYLDESACSAPLAEGLGIAHSETAANGAGDEASQALRAFLQVVRLDDLKVAFDGAASDSSSHGAATSVEADGSALPHGSSVRGPSALDQLRTVTSQLAEAARQLSLAATRDDVAELFDSVATVEANAAKREAWNEQESHTL